MLRRAAPPLFTLLLSSAALFIPASPDFEPPPNQPFGVAEISVPSVPLLPSREEFLIC